MRPTRFTGEKKWALIRRLTASLGGAAAVGSELFRRGVLGAMSYRELRNFTEIMRALGYPRLISVENFRTPNFALVAHILYWLVERYDPEIRVSDVIDSENERVDFIMTITQVMMSKARIKLNAKKLYAADGYAVKELLKIATVLYKAQRSNVSKTEEEEETEAPLNSRMQDVRAARTLASDITERGARLYDLLAQEGKLQQARAKSLRFLDSISSNLQSTSENEYIERSIRESMSSLQLTAENLKKQSAELEADERALESKIKKKQTDLERGEKRLKSLQTVRPAFMDEYEKLEKELQRQYEIYLGRFRNIEYLEHELDLYHQSEKEKLEASDRQLKKMQKRLREEELKLLRGEQDLKEQDGEVVSSGKKHEHHKGSKAAAAKGGKDGPRAGSKASGEKGHHGKGAARPVAQVTGSMAARDEEESGSEDNSEAESHGHKAGPTGGSDSEEVSVGGSESGSDSGSDLIDDDDDQDGSDDLSDDDNDEEADSGEDF